MRVCSFVCCNGVCKSGLSSTKTKFEDVDPVQFNIDESANCKANTATYGEGSESDGSSDSVDTGTKTLASEILNRFQKWLESLLDAIKIRDVFLGERTDEKYSPATIKP